MLGTELLVFEVLGSESVNLILYAPSTNFQFNRDESSWVELS